VENLLAVGLCLLIGLSLRHARGLDPDRTAATLNTFAIYVPLPALILRQLAVLEAGPELLLPAVAPWVLLLASAALVLALARLWGWERGTLGALLLVVPLGNTSFLGLPLTEAWLGAEALPAAIIYDQVGSFSALAIYGSLIVARFGAQPATIDPAHARVGAPTATVDPAHARVGAPPATDDPTQVRVGAPTATVDPTQVRVGAPTATVDPTQVRVGAPTAAVDPAQAQSGAPTAAVDPGHTRVGPQPAAVDPGHARVGAQPAAVGPTHARVGPQPAAVDPTQARFGSPPAGVTPGHARIRPTAVARKLLLFPPFIAFIAAALWGGLAPWDPPPLVLGALDVIAASLVPAVIVAVGLQWRLTLASEHRAPVLAGLTIKLAVTPTLAWLLVTAIGLSGPAADATIFEAAMGPMITAGALAAAAGLAPTLVASVVGWGTVASLASSAVVHALFLPT